MAVTKQDIADYLGISRTAVSLALNQSSKCTLSEKNKKRIFEAARELGYPLSTGSVTRKICAALFDVNSRQAYTTDYNVINEVDDYLGGLGYNMVYLNVSNTERSLRRFYKYIESGDADGLVIFSLLDRTVLERVEQLGISYVVFSEMDGNVPNCCSPDAAYAAREMTRKLIGLGHRDIAFWCCDLKYPQQRHLLEGYRTALEAAGIPFNPSLVQASSREDGQELAARMKYLGIPYTAALCSNNTIQFGALAWLRDNGVSVPKQVSLLGYGVGELMKLSQPQLSTFCYGDFINLGMAQLMESIQNGSKTYPCQWVQEGDFYAGGTLAPVWKEEAAPAGEREAAPKAQ